MMTFDYIIIMRMYGIILTNNITQIYICHLCVSIYSQAAAGQSNPGYKVIPILPSPNIKAKKKEKKTT